MNPNLYEIRLTGTDLATLHTAIYCRIDECRKFVERALADPVLCGSDYWQGELERARDIEKLLTQALTGEAS